MNSTLKNLLLSVCIAIVVAALGTVLALLVSEYGQIFIEWLDR